MTNLVAGTAYLAVDGMSFPLVGDLLYSVSAVSRETVKGMDGVHGYKEAPTAGYIEATIRNTSTLEVAAFNAQTNVTVTVQLANGKMVVGRNMWTVGDAEEVNAAEGTLKVRWEGMKVTETPAA
jgi:hypothetical protein